MVLIYYTFYIIMSTCQTCQTLECRIDEVLAIIGGKWTFQLLLILKAQPSRFGELEQAMPTITPRMLSARLKGLLGAGLVQREEQDGHAIYHLTAEAADLIMIIERFEAWSEQFMQGRQNRGTHQILRRVYG